MENKYLVDIYQVLLTMSVEPQTGLVKYDLPLIRSLFDLFKVDDEEREFASTVLLYMVMECTKIRLKKRKLEFDKEKAKRDLKDFKREVGRR